MRNLLFLSFLMLTLWPCYAQHATARWTVSIEGDAQHDQSQPSMIKLGTLQDTDTIFVSHQRKSYLLFDAPVSLVDIGNPALYDARIEGNSVFVVAKQDSAATSPIYVVTGEQVFLGMLSFQQTPAAFYDFRKGKAKQALKDESTSAFVLERLESLQRQKDLNHGTTRKDGITFRLAGIMHDLSATYLKFYIRNKTSVIYQTDFIGFERLQRYKKGFFAKEKEAHFPLQPLTSLKTAPILPYAEGYLYYALPIQALSKQEALVATLREQHGSRTLSLKMGPRLLRHADVY